MTPLDLDRLLLLEQAASPAPWFVRHLNDDVCMSAVAVATTPEPDDVLPSPDWPETEIVAACLIQSPAYVIPDDQRSDENAELIAAMRNALPELLRLAKIAAESAESIKPRSLLSD